MNSIRIAILFFISINISFSNTTAASSKNITELGNAARLNKIIETYRDRIIILDFYANWCYPCRQLSPVLKALANKYPDRTYLIKINVDKHPGIASAYSVRGIPHVVFLKNKTAVYALTGLYRESDYERILLRYSESVTMNEPDKPSGTIIDGTRIIEMHKNLAKLDIYVYQGDSVKMIFGIRKYKFSVHIPQFNISEESAPGKILQIEFNAEKSGIFPIYCNGDCPVGDGTNAGKIFVMKHKTESKTVHTNISAEKAYSMIKNKRTLILDVRTAREYYDGHIENSLLIPLGQLKQRLNEINSYKETDIIVYCRSGNRSIVASETLSAEGFKRVYNLKHGIRGWIRKGYKITK